jgi:hypothetical protein
VVARARAAAPTHTIPKTPHRLATAPSGGSRRLDGCADSDIFDLRRARAQLASHAASDRVRRRRSSTREPWNAFEFGTVVATA